MTTQSTTAGRRTVTAFFDDRSEAERAVQKLTAAGIARDSIQLIPGSERTTSGQASTSTSSYPSSEGTGFWEALKDLFLPDEDRNAYAEGLRRGGYLLSVRASDADYGRVVDILDDEGTIDMDERESSWRSQGWAGYSEGSSTMGGAASTAYGASGGTSATGSASSTDRTAATGYGGSSTDRTAATGYGASSTDRTTSATGREESIPVVEEELRVGKREVNQGRVRVRSYVVETPVQEDVTLREESVRVERRPVDRPLTAGDDANLFRERTIEAEERGEEAVVSKEARVKEELVVKKDVEERTQTVSDSVRRTEVEVEDERTRASRLSGTGGTTTDRNR